MRKFTFLIGSTDDFESIEDLKACYFSGDHNFSDYNASVFEFEVPEDAGTDEHTVRDIATYIGRGLAFSNGWCMDDTVSTLLGA
jgi:hypothetical protein